MGRVQIDTRAAGAAGAGPTVMGAPYSESVTFLLNPPVAMVAAPSATIVPSFTLQRGDYISVIVQGTDGAGTLSGGTIVYVPNSGSIGNIQIRAGTNGIVVSVPGSYFNSNAIITVTFYRYSEG